MIILIAECRLVRPSSITAIRLSGVRGGRRAIQMPGIMTDASSRAGRGGVEYLTSDPAHRLSCSGR